MARGAVRGARAGGGGGAPGAGGRRAPRARGPGAGAGAAAGAGTGVGAGEGALLVLEQWVRCSGGEVRGPGKRPSAPQRGVTLATGTAGAAVVAVASGAAEALAADIDPFFQFQPVCPYSDGVFRTGQKAALLVAGSDNIEDYRPLINDVLIRVRTELCVLESFARETAIPFVQQKGLGWVLPLHETSETYLAGVVFMVGTNFILLGSTKVVAILAIYHDIILGFPARQLGRLLGLAGADGEARTQEEIDRLLGEQSEEMRAVMSNRELGAGDRSRETAQITTEYARKMEEVRGRADAKALERETSPLGKLRKSMVIVGVPLGFYGLASQKLKEVLELFDTFCSRYFVALTVLYVIIKTAHYVFFPDIFSDTLPSSPDLSLPTLPSALSLRGL